MLTYISWFTALRTKCSVSVLRSYLGLTPGKDKQKAVDCIWCWPIFHGPVILLHICNTISWIYIILRILVAYDTMNDLIILLGQWAIFYGPVILLHISIWWIYIILGILVQYDTMGDLIILPGHFDLYFMVQWFCSISSTLFHGFTLYFEYWFIMTL